MNLFTIYYKLFLFVWTKYSMNNNEPLNFQLWVRGVFNFFYNVHKFRIVRDTIILYIFLNYHITIL